MWQLENFSRRWRAMEDCGTHEKIRRYLTKQAATTIVRGSGASDACSPGAYADVIHVGVHGDGHNGVDSPGGWLERGSDLSLAHATRTESAGLPIAEAQHVVAPAYPRSGSQRCDEPGSIFIVENVKQSAVQHSVEVLTQIGQFEGIPDQEAGHQAAFSSLLPCEVDCLMNGVDTDGVESASGCHQRVFTGSTADVKHASRQRAVFCQLEERRLWPPDVPWRGTGVVRSPEAVNLLRRHGAKRTNLVARAAIFTSQ